MELRIIFYFPKTFVYLANALKICYTGLMSQLVSLKAYSGMKICVACSGGVDSVALLHSFYEQASEYGITLTALTCEHGIRGKESLRDAAFVRALCEKWEIPFFEYHADIPALAKRSGRGLEEEGRAFRYRCFDEVIKSGRADAVATAHHKDDLAETVLFRLARGTSIAGLNAIQEREGIVRPFLNVSRAEIERYAGEHKLKHMKDSSNRDEKYMRNRIRYHVMPTLENVVHGAGEHLVRFAYLAAEDDVYLQSLAAEQTKILKNEVRFPANLPKPLFARACVIALRTMGVESYSEKNLAEVAALCDNQTGKRASLPSGAEAVKEGGEIVIFRPQAAPQEVPFRLGETVFGEYLLTASEERAADALRADFNAFPAGCVVRTRREGDVFQPFKGSLKPLKEYLTDKKIPARVGHNLPLIACGKEVYAIFGLEISDKVKVSVNTLKQIYLSVKTIV